MKEGKGLFDCVREAKEKRRHTRLCRTLLVPRYLATEYVPRPRERSSERAQWAAGGPWPGLRYVLRHVQYLILRASITARALACRSPQTTPFRWPIYLYIGKKCTRQYVNCHQLWFVDVPNLCDALYRSYSYILAKLASILIEVVCHFSQYLVDSSWSHSTSHLT